MAAVKREVPSFITSADIPNLNSNGKSNLSNSRFELTKLPPPAPAGTMHSSVSSCQSAF